MRCARALAIPVFFTLVGSAVAAPEPDPRAPSLDGRRGRVAGFVQLGAGYRGIFPFDEEYCGEDDPDKAYCLGRSPFALEIGGAYGLTRALEVMASLGFGLETDFGAAPGADEGPRTVVFAPGVRLALTEVGSGWLTATLELPIDFSSYDQADAVDVGVRNRNAVEVPIGRLVSFYGFFGETATWRRWFRFELDVGAGILVRR
jgi:hypothetical protein